VSAEGQPHRGCGRHVAGVARRASGSSSSEVGCEAGLDVLNQDLFVKLIVGLLELSVNIKWIKGALKGLLEF
jgi:hypothetical protein